MRKQSVLAGLRDRKFEAIHEMPTIQVDENTLNAITFSSVDINDTIDVANVRSRNKERYRTRSFQQK